jgi:predicted  nucleic acid-binding Zn-ribbon protein
MLAGIAAERGWDEAELARQLDTRERVLRGMLEGGVRDYREVAATIHAFSKDPEAVLADLGAAVETDLVAAATGHAAEDAATDADPDADADAEAEAYSTPVAGFDMSIFDRPVEDGRVDADPCADADGPDAVMANAAGSDHDAEPEPEPGTAARRDDPTEEAGQ